MTKKEARVYSKGGVTINGWHATLLPSPKGEPQRFTISLVGTITEDVDTEEFKEAIKEYVKEYK